ncbi:hypothetical protein PMI13_01332 [Chryseobacterium populi]|uniref:Uncharacterized protein n=1 Tax=Chryseobacterium populi TaxID=1144316 RepID=J2K180_9FLAO|nr:hypothetical protein PMI13_01332 [Chryseobacterium populi]
MINRGFQKTFPLLISKKYLKNIFILQNNFYICPIKMLSQQNISQVLSGIFISAAASVTVIISTATTTP